MKVFLTPNDKGHLTIVYPPYDDSARSSVFPGLTDDEVLDAVIQIRIEAGLQTAGAPIYREEDTNLPADHSFFRAWEWGNGGVRVNMVKARAIHMDNIRVIRDAALVKLDVSFLRAVESLDKAAQIKIANQKRVLRDIPQTLDLDQYKTAAALKAAIPAGLVDN